MRNIKTWRRLYDEALKEENYDFIDQVIMPELWGLKWVRKAYEKYAKSLGYKNPLQADEQMGLSITFAHEVIFGNKI